MQKYLTLAAALAAALIYIAAVLPQAQAADRHIGYYYPDPGEPEVYEARVDTLPEASRAARIGFVTGIASENHKRPYPPSLTMFAKGTEAQKLIIVALRDGPLDSLFRARAVFADMTAIARTLPIFREMGVEDYFTFFDLCKMMGFEKITVSDGKDFAHQVLLK